MGGSGGLKKSRGSRNDYMSSSPESPSDFYAYVAEPVRTAENFLGSQLIDKWLSFPFLLKGNFKFFLKSDY